MKNKRELLNSLCRICAKEDPNSIEVFGENAKKQNIIGKIHVCLPLTVKENDGMPKQICLTCVNKLDASWDLFILCKEAQNEIEKKLNSTKFVNNAYYEISTQAACGVCNHPVQDDDEGVGCEGPCQKWHHIVCIKMSKEEYFDLINNPEKVWICSSCKGRAPLPKVVKSQVSPPIEERLQNLSESKPVVFADSAVICLAPASSPPPPPPIIPREAPTLPQTVGGGSAETVLGTPSVMAPVTYLTPSTAPSAAPTAPPPVTEDLYPQALIQVPRSPNREPVVYQATSVPAPRRRPVVPKPIAAASTPQTASQSPQRPAPAPVRRQNTEAVNGPPSKKAPQMCKYCNKTFPDDIIDHHVSLHLRQSFMTCIDCNKNFRSEEAMNRHRCGVNETITLDPDDEDEPILIK